MVSSPVFLENIKETWKKWCGIELALCLILALLILSCVPTGESLLLGLEEYFLDPALKLVSLKLTDPSVSGTVATVFFGFWRFCSRRYTRFAGRKSWWRREWRAAGSSS